MSPTPILVATTNAGKLAELRAIFAAAFPGVALTDLGAAGIDAQVEETGATLAENARIKALAYHALWRGPVLADDSGLFVDALGGEPGVHSARFAGPGRDAKANLELVLARMKGVPAEKRTARFQCALAFAHADGSLTEARGALEGSIHPHAQGTHGFGYDPILWLPDRRCTFAEMPAEEKNRLSHRRRAIDALVDALKDGGFASPRRRC